MSPDLVSASAAIEELPPKGGKEAEGESQQVEEGSAEELFHDTRLTDRIIALKEVRPYSDEAKQLQEGIKGSQHTTRVML